MTIDEAMIKVDKFTTDLVTPIKTEEGVITVATALLCKASTLLFVIGGPRFAAEVLEKHADAMLEKAAQDARL